MATGQQHSVSFLLPFLPFPSFLLRRLSRALSHDHMPATLVLGGLAHQPTSPPLGGVSLKMQPAVQWWASPPHPIFGGPLAGWGWRPALPSLRGSQAPSTTPELMALEFLRGEPANEKSDVYSFGVILWELVTLEQPWNGLSHAKVVGVIAFQNRRPSIPPNVSPVLASLMEACWADDPADRPSFASIVESLKKMLKSPADAIKMGGT